MKKTTLTFLLFWMGWIAYSQVPLNLEEAISKMKTNNTQLLIQQQEIDLTQAELSETLGGYLPSVKAEFTGFRTNDPLNSFGFKLQQKSVTEMDFNPMLLNNPHPLYHFNTKFSIQQPLLNFDAFAARKALKEKLNANQFQKEFAEAALKVEIEKAFTNLQFLYEAEKAVGKGVEAYEEVLRNTENMKVQGYTKESDVLMVRVGLSEVKNQAIEIENNIGNLSDYLSWLMGETPGNIYKPETDLQLNEISGSNLKLSENRADILAMESGIEAMNKMEKMNKNGLLPRLNAFGEYNLNDKEIVKFGAKSYMLGVALTWDVFDGNKTRSKIKQSHINTDKSKSELKLYIEQNQLELQKQQRDLQSDEARLSLTKTAEEQARESFRILNNRYNQGLEKTADLLIAQATQLEKQVDYLKAIKNYNLTMIQIKFLTE